MRPNNSVDESLLCLPDFQVQYQKTPVSNVLEASGQVAKGLEDLLSASFALANHLAVCRAQRHTWTDRIDRKTYHHQGPAWGWGLQREGGPSQRLVLNTSLTIL